MREGPNPGFMYVYIYIYLIKVVLQLSGLQVQDGDVDMFQCKTLLEFAYLVCFLPVTKISRQHPRYSADVPHQVLHSQTILV